VPLPDIGKGIPPALEMLTRTQFGAQFPVSAYFTENVNVVAVVPLPGVALPALSRRLCPFLLEHDAGLAPQAVVVASKVARIAE
jgi:hypothetical protein